MSMRLISIAIGAAILGASAAAGAQTTSSKPGESTSSKPGESMSSQTKMQNQIDFKAMDTNSDGMISREEYVGYYGGRFDRMKRNDKGMVMMNDMRTWDGGRNNPTSDAATKSRPGVKGGAGTPPATGGG